MLGLTEIAITVAVIGVLLALVMTYACMKVSGDWSEWEREQYREQTGKEPPW